MSFINLLDFQTNSASSNTLQKGENTAIVDYKTFICPKCMRHYDIQFRNGTFLGRVPLVLPCKHTVCEECVRTDLARRLVSCRDCSLTIPIDEEEKRKPQQLYYINFYVLGLFFYIKPELSQFSKFGWKPAGVSYSKRGKAIAQKPSLNLSQQLITPSMYSEVTCSLLKCSKPATLKCISCDDVFCNACSNELHKATKSFMNHKIESLEAATPEIKNRCKNHPDSFLDFYCKSCNENACCYCIVQAHNGHDYEQLTFLDSSKLCQFELLLQNSEDVLKKMEATQKKVQWLLSRSSTTGGGGEVEKQISKYFTNLHAALQLLENKLKMEALAAKNASVMELSDINAVLCHNIFQLSNLITMAKSIIQPHKVAARLNVNLVKNKLEDALKLPCCLLDQSSGSTNNVEFRVCGDFLDKLEESFVIIKNEEKKFKLLNTDEIPEDYNSEMDKRNYSPSSSASSIIGGGTDGRTSSTSFLNESPLSPGERLSRALSISNNNVSDIYLSSDSVDAAGLDRRQTEKEVFPGLEAGSRLTFGKESVPLIEAKEMVLVTHINSPECFYVQLFKTTNNLQKLSRDINAYVKNNCVFNAARPEINQLYIVKYNTKSGHQWCRGRVIERINENFYNVFFIDYGNIEKIKGQQIIEISPELARVKPFALECRLFNLFPVDGVWNKKAMILMAQVIEGRGKKVIMIMKNKEGGVYEVDLLAVSVEGDMTSVREALLYFGYANTYCESPQPERKYPLTSNVKLFKRSNNFKKDQCVSIQISHIEDPNEFYVQAMDFVHHIETLSKNMEKYYEQKPNMHVIYVPEKDMPIAVKWNNKWYRGTVQHTAIGQGSLTASLVDYGTTVDVGIGAVRKLVENFARMECQAIPVKLADIEIVNPEIAKAFLKGYIDKENLKMVIIRTEKPFEVAIFESFPAYDININVLLVQEGAALSTGPISENLEWRKESEPHPEEKNVYTLDLLKTIQGKKSSDNSYEKDSDCNEEHTNTGIKKAVTIISVESPDLLYVTLDDEKTQNEQRELQLSLQEYYSKRQPCEKEWNVNDFCVIVNKDLATYSRGIIVEKLEHKYKVMECDFGKYVVVPASSLLPLEEKFKAYSEGVIKCHLAEIKPAGDKEEWPNLATEFLEAHVKNIKQFFISKGSESDPKKKSIPVRLWYQEVLQGGALERSRIKWHCVNELLVENGLALRNKTANVKDLDITTIDFKTDQKENIQPQVHKEQATKKKTFQIHRKNKRMKEKNVETSTSDSDIQYEKKAQAKLKFENTLASNSTSLQISLASSTATATATITTSDVSSFIAPAEVVVERRKSESNVCIKEEVLTNVSSFSENNSPAHILIDKKEPSVDWNSIIEMESSASESKVEQFQAYQGGSTDSLKSASPLISSPDKVTWLPPLPLKKRQFEAIATFVDNYGVIYLHDVELEPVLQEMEREMKKIFDNCPVEPADTKWFKGQLCTVKYFVNHSWYRGEVIRVSGDAIKVRMIDYGNEEDCKHEDLRLRIMFHDIPSIASTVYLHNVFPLHKWITSDLDKLHATVVDKRITVCLKGKPKKNKPVPAIIFAEGKNINQYMLQLSSNLSSERVKENTKVVSDESDDVVILAEGTTSDDSHINEINEKTEEKPVTNKFSHLQLPDIDPSTKIEAAIISIVNYNKIIFELPTEDCIDEFEKMSEEISENGENQPVLQDLQVGQACIAKFSEDNNWYRAEICSVELEQKKANVWFVDFGNFEDVPLDMIRAIRPEWLRLPIQQFIAEIDSIKLPEQADENDIQEIVKELSDHMQKLKRIQVIERQPLKIRVFENDAERLIYQDLIDNGKLISVN